MIFFKLEENKKYARLKILSEEKIYFMWEQQELNLLFLLQKQIA